MCWAVWLSVSAARIPRGTKSNQMHLYKLFTTNTRCRRKLHLERTSYFFSFCRIIVSAVHRSRRAGAGVLTNFAGAGAGAGVCSPPAKLRQHLFVLQTSIIDQRKN